MCGSEIIGVIDRLDISEDVRRRIYHENTVK